MSMPGFTAENSLDNKAGYNTVPSRMVGLLAQPKKGIYPAVEVIGVESCGPGQWDLRDSDGNLMGCVDVGGGGGAGGDGGSGTGGPTGGKGGGGGKGGQQKPPEPSGAPDGFRICKVSEFRKISQADYSACFDQDIINHAFFCTKKRGIPVCCTRDPQTGLFSCPPPKPTRGGYSPVKTGVQHQ